MLTLKDEGAVVEIKEIPMRAGQEIGEIPVTNSNGKIDNIL